MLSATLLIQPDGDGADPGHRAARRPVAQLPFFATDQDPRGAGHVEAEYFLEGTASGHHYKNTW